MTSRARCAKAPKPGREDMPRVIAAEALRAAPPANTSHKTTPAAIAASLAIGPKGLSRVTTRPGPRCTGGGAGSVHSTC